MPKYVLVDTVSMFRIRYAVAVNEDFDDTKAIVWASDSITCEDVEEFSQLHLGETITASRILSKEELLRQFDVDNDYFVNWQEKDKMKCVLDLDAEE